MANSRRDPAVTPPANDNALCAICGKPRALKYDPFCSKRCADVDLYRWLSGSYVIPGDDDATRDPDGMGED